MQIPVEVRRRETSATTEAQRPCPTRKRSAGAVLLRACTTLPSESRSTRRVPPDTRRTRPRAALSRHAVRRSIHRKNNPSNRKVSTSLFTPHFNRRQRIFQEVQRRVKPRFHCRHRAPENIRHLFELESLI